MSLVLAAQLRGAVEAFGGLGEAQERDLPDFHTVVEGDGQASDVAEFQGEATAPAGIDETGGAVDQESDAPEAALTLEAGDEVVGQFDVFEGAAEDELAGVEDELVVALDLHLLGEVRLGLAHIDVGATRVGEDEEPIVEVEVDAGRLDIIEIDWIDDDPTLIEFTADGAVAEYHGRSLEQFVNAVDHDGYSALSGGDGSVRSRSGFKREATLE